MTEFIGCFAFFLPLKVGPKYKYTEYNIVLPCTSLYPHESILAVLLKLLMMKAQKRFCVDAR